MIVSEEQIDEAAAARVRAIGPVTQFEVSSMALDYKNMRKVRRTMRERWLSRPWRPWQRHRMEASPCAIRVTFYGRDTVYIHPEIAERLAASSASFRDALSSDCLT